MDILVCRLIALLFAALIAGCATDPRYAVAVYYADVVPRGNRTTPGAPVYYGLPPRPYLILGGNLAGSTQSIG